jgi:hypothetical protein
MKGLSERATLESSMEEMSQGMGQATLPANDR